MKDLILQTNDFVGLTFLIPSLLLTFYYNFLCWELYNYKKNKFDPKKAKSIFGYSILYLYHYICTIITLTSRIIGLISIEVHNG